MENKITNIKTECSTIIQRIDDKISSLYKILESICVNNPSEAAEPSEEQTSSIIMEMRNIENRITRLLDSIRI